MEYWEALVEWQSGGLEEVPSEHMRFALNELLAEFAQRGETPCAPVAWMDPLGSIEALSFSFEAESGWIPLMQMVPTRDARP